MGSVGIMSSGLEEDPTAWNGGKGGLWLPPGVGVGPEENVVDFDAIAYPDDMKPSSAHHVEDKWTLKFPIEMGGLFVQVSAVKRPTQGSGYQTTYGLRVARFYSENEWGDDIGYLTREEFKSMIGHMQTALEDSEG